MKGQGPDPAALPPCRTDGWTPVLCAIQASSPHLAIWALGCSRVHRVGLVHDHDDAGPGDGSEGSSQSRLIRWESDPTHADTFRSLVQACSSTDRLCRRLLIVASVSWPSNVPKSTSRSSKCWVKASAEGGRGTIQASSPSRYP